MLHANYGVATLDALRQVASDGAIYAAAGLDARAAQADLAQTQDRATAAWLRACPALAPDLPQAAPPALRRGLIGMGQGNSAARTLREAVAHPGVGISIAIGATWWAIRDRKVSPWDAFLLGAAGSYVANMIQKWSERSTGL